LCGGGSAQREREREREHEAVREPRCGSSPTVKGVGV
jgi:hypothetical protein